MIKELENDILLRLSTAKSNVLEDVALIESLEKTKMAVGEIEIKQHEAAETSAKIDEAREFYRSVAKRGVIIYFAMLDMSKIHSLYKFSLKTFKNIFDKALKSVIPSLDKEIHLINIMESITLSLFNYTTMGLFEKHKMIFTYHLLFQIQLEKEDINASEVTFLFEYPYMKQCISPIYFLNDVQWGGIKALATIKGFEIIEKEIEASVNQWKKLIESDAPERENSPQDWKNKTSIQKLCLIRALRKDRMTSALSQYLEDKMGKFFTINRKQEFGKLYQESSKNVAIIFILSPGVNPFIDVENYGKRLGLSSAKKTLHYVSMGQGQEKLTEKVLKLASKHGHWVILQNIHLVPSWLPTLEKVLNLYSEKADENYRIFMSIEANENLNLDIIPNNILESSIKVMNENPEGKKALF